jgi:hypothetical protein
VDYGETFSPVIKPANIHLVLGIASSKAWSINQLDVKNTFLHGNLSESVYAQQPSRFVSASHLNSVCKLNKSLYGLKQAPRTWFLQFTAFLATLGFRGSKSDTSLFILCHGSSTIYLLMYVDGIILTASSTSILHHLINKLKSEFSMSDLRPCIRVSHSNWSLSIPRTICIRPAPMWQHAKLQSLQYLSLDAYCSLPLSYISRW